MGEFVGIDPRWAQELIRRLAAGKEVLGRTRPGLDAAIAEAGQDWAGHLGTTAMHRAWAFYHESQQDLKWRVDTLEQLVPVRERGMLTGTFPFGSETEAVRAAEQTAATVLQALRHRPDDPGTAADTTGGTAGDSTADTTADTVADREARPGSEAVSGVDGEVERALAAAEGRTGDPAYAAALLTALGTDTFARVLASGGGVLAEAFASAERTGRLGDEWYELVDRAAPGVLTNLITLAAQSGPLLNRVATGLLDRAATDRPDQPGLGLRELVRAYDGNPLAFQQLLAEHPSQARVLLEAATGDPALEEALASTLREALKPGVGADGLRERAWRTVIRGTAPEVRGTPPETGGTAPETGGAAPETGRTPPEIGDR